MKRDIRVDKVKKNFYITLLILIAVLTLTYIYTRPPKVVKVTEHTTLVLNNGEEIKLMGVDTGSQAETFIRTRVEGREVTLKYGDQKEGNGGQILAYVYLSDDSFLNAEIITQGYGCVDKEIPSEYIEMFERCQKDAEEKKRGMWAE